MRSTHEAEQAPAGSAAAHASSSKPARHAAAAHLDSSPLAHAGKVLPEVGQGVGACSAAGQSEEAV